MFEHMKNYRELLRRVSTWLKPGGKLFVHIFVHRHMPYHFEARRTCLLLMHVKSCVPIPLSCIAACGDLVSRLAAARLSRQSD